MTPNRKTDPETRMAKDLFESIREDVVKVLLHLHPNVPPSALSRIEVTPSRDPQHGDASSNVALMVARTIGQTPSALSASISGEIRKLPGYADAQPAGPGFVNIVLDRARLRDVIPAILRDGERYGDSSIGGGLAVNVEYVSANPTGPMHVGHCRGAVVGDALMNLMRKAGYAVTGEYYVNDSGTQVTALAWAAYWRYLQAIGSPLSEAEFAGEVPGGLQYRGDYLIAVGAALAAQHGAALATEARGIAAPELWLETVRDVTVAAMLHAIKQDLHALGIDHDVFSSERALVESGAADVLIERLRTEDLVYEGTLDPPKGKQPEDWEPRPQTLFRATKFGDDIDRPLRKSDGSNTYFANDIAYHADKVARGFKLLIDVLGANHGGYVPRIRAAVRAVSHGQTAFEAVLCQMVHLVKGGQPALMSKRAGTFVLLRDLIDEVGKDAVRFAMLTRKPEAQMDFDLDQVVAQTRDNPVFYVQYAHARCRSVLRAAAEMFGADRTTDAALAGVPLDALEAEPELAMLRRLAAWPGTVSAAAMAREPHRIAFFLYDLAADFHMLWNRGKEDAALRFLQAERPAETLARLALVAATATVIRSGLAVMGVTPVEEMR